MTDVQILWTMIIGFIAYLLFGVPLASFMGRYLKRRREAVEAETSLARSLDMETELAGAIEGDMLAFAREQKEAR